jgi:hypothetical protein
VFFYEVTVTQRLFFTNRGRLEVIALAGLIPAHHIHRSVLKAGGDGGE